jgi:hypothetical protein
MKRLFTIFALVLFGLIGNAQYIYNDFDANQNDPFSGVNNNPEIVANPDASGINTSANVAQWERGEGFQWAHVYTELDGKIDFETGTMFKLKVHSPIACEVLFKLEDKTNAGTFTEVMGNVTTANQWQEITYDFSGAASGTYDKIVIFFDFSTTVNNTFFFDDVEGPEYGAGVTPGDPVALPVTFDDDEINYGLTDFGGNASEIVVDPTNAENKVAKSIKTDVAETWAGTTVGGTVGFGTPIPFAEGTTTMTVAVWSPTTDTPIRLKVEAANDPTISVETETNTTIAEAWEVITFDFSNEAPGTEPLSFDKSYNKASIFFNFGTDGATAGEQTYYWDDMEFAGGGAEPKPLEAWDVQDNFEDDGYATITDWKFQDPELMDLTIVADPMNAENHVAEYNRSGTFEWTNAQFILDHRMNLSVRNKFEIMVYFPSTNAYDDMLTPTAALKLQNSLLGGEAWTTQTEIKLNVEEFDAWVTLEFDFAEVADREDYDQVVVQLGGEGHTVPGMFYFDDIHLMDNSSIWEQGIKTFEIFPNPVSEEFVIEGIENISMVKIYNMQGQVVVAKSGNTSVLNVSQLASGVYQVVAETADGILHTSKML